MLHGSHAREVKEVKERYGVTEDPSYTINSFSPKPKAVILVVYKSAGISLTFRPSS